MAISRTKFTLEFRTEAAHRVIDTGQSVRAVASELSIEGNTLKTCSNYWMGSSSHI
jgi:transposase